MQIPLQISFHHCEPSDALSAHARQKAEELEQFYPRITGCQVFIERPGHHHRKGKGAHYRIRVEVSVPGERVVVSRDPDLHKANEDPYLAVDEAFHAVRRQLQDYARVQRGDIKAHVGPTHGRIKRLGEAYGFIEAADGREIYFHRDSVLDAAFDRLAVGDEVRFTEEVGEKGPQASTVQTVGGEGHHEVTPPT